MERKATPLMIFSEMNSENLNFFIRLSLLNPDCGVSLVTIIQVSYQKKEVPNDMKPDTIGHKYN
jgi:hypothetical protein